MSYSVELRRYFSNWHACLTIIVLGIATIYTDYHSYLSGKEKEKDGTFKEGYIK